MVNSLVPFYSEALVGSYLPLQVGLPMLEDNSGNIHLLIHALLRETMDI